MDNIFMFLMNPPFQLFRARKTECEPIYILVTVPTTTTTVGYGSGEIEQPEEKWKNVEFIHSEPWQNITHYDTRYYEGTVCPI